MVARPEFADHFFSYYGRQESEQSVKDQQSVRLDAQIRNCGIVFQEAQPLDPFSVPMLHLFYGDKSFFGAHRGHYPIYGEDDENKKQICIFSDCMQNTLKYAFISYYIQSQHHDESQLFSREPLKCARGSASQNLVSCSLDAHLRYRQEQEANSGLRV